MGIGVALFVQPFPNIFSKPYILGFIYSKGFKTKLSIHKGTLGNRQVCLISLRFINIGFMSKRQYYHGQNTDFEYDSAQ